MQYDLIEDTKVDFGDLANCVYAPWHAKDPQYNVIPIPEVQPTHVVFDSSFAAFNAYPESKENEAKPFTSMSAWFMNMPLIQDVKGFEYIYDGITDFSLTFCLYGYSNNDKALVNDNPNAITVLDLTNFKQNNLANVVGTFCNSLFSQIIIPQGFAPKSTSFGTRYVLAGIGETYMSLFYGCKASKIEILGPIGAGVKDFTALYGECSGLKTFADAGIDKIDFSKAEIVDEMFAKSQFSSITIPESLKTSTTIKSMSNLFYNANASNIDLTGLDTSNVTNMEYMFYRCFNVDTIDLSALNLASVTDTSYMFDTLDSSTKLECVKFPNDANKTFQKLEKMDSMFEDCGSLKTIESIN